MLWQLDATLPYDRLSVHGRQQRLLWCKRLADIHAAALIFMEQEETKTDFHDAIDRASWAEAARHVTHAWARQRIREKFADFAKPSDSGFATAADL